MPPSVLDFVSQDEEESSASDYERSYTERSHEIGKAR
jgi:hypothetical protein